MLDLENPADLSNPEIYTLVIQKNNGEYNKYLKEFMVQNPPCFRISKKCCTYAKKKVSLKYIKDNNIECMITGLRKSEGGIRSVKIKTCFDIGNDVASYRPLFWLSNDDESEYIKIFDNINILI